jgi:DNA-binding transcriptional LysR family regulator
MTLHQLRVFTTVADFKSFTKAAEKLEVRQPSVTLLVRSLQLELGAKLFERLGNSVHLTRAGEELFHRVQEILARVDILKDALDEIQGLKKGKLSVGGSAMAGASFLPAAIHAFQNQHSGVDIFLRIEPSKVLEKMLLEGVIDVGILGRSSHSPHLLVKPYREEKVIVIAPPRHPLSKKRSVSLEVLAKERFVVGKKGESPVRDGAEAIFEGHISATLCWWGHGWESRVTRFRLSSASRSSNWQELSMSRFIKTARAHLWFEHSTPF